MAAPQAKTNIPNIQKNDRSWLKCPDRREEEQRVNRFISVFLVRGEMGVSFVLLRFDINSCDLAGKSIEKFEPLGMQGKRSFLRTSCGFCPNSLPRSTGVLDKNRLRNILRKIMFAFVLAWSYSMASGA
jgi:hypothetical protein